MDKILPENIVAPIREFLNFSKLYEIRLRCNKPVVVGYGSGFRYLTPNGTSSSSNGAIVLSQKAIESIVFKASDNSIYSVNEQIKQGFITVGGGVRIGICGEIVPEGKGVRTIKSVSSLNIRIPHEVKDCAFPCFEHLVNGRIANVLVVSPPGAGKTTYLRDLCRQYSMVSPIISVFVVDERGEIGASVNGEVQLDIGDNTDIVTSCTKSFGFNQGIRTMRPDIIVTDELATEEDVEAVERAIASGVKVAASVHAYDHIDLTLKRGFERLISKRMINRFVVLSCRRGPGTLEGVYDESFNCLTMGV